PASLCSRFPRNGSTPGDSPQDCPYVQAVRKSAFVPNVCLLVRAGRGYRGAVRVLFFVDRPGVLRQFASLVTELAARGHDVHLALRQEPDEDQRPQVERLVGRSPRVTAGPAPERRQQDGWRAVAWAVRA